MLKNILNLKGVKVLCKNAQRNLKGGFGCCDPLVSCCTPRGTCGSTCVNCAFCYSSTCCA